MAEAVLKYDKFALEWLKQLEQFEHTGKLGRVQSYSRVNVPKIVTDTGSADVKLCRNGTVVFSDRQWNLLSKYPLCYILIYDAGSDDIEPRTVILVDELATTELPCIIDGIRYTISKQEAKATARNVKRMSAIANGTVPTLSVREASQYVGISDETIYRKLHSGRLQGEIVGGRWILQRETVVQYAVDHLFERGK